MTQPSKRLTISLPGPVHAYLTNYAHETSQAAGERISIAAVVSEICVQAVATLREHDANRRTRS